MLLCVFQIVHLYQLLLPLLPLLTNFILCLNGFRVRLPATGWLLCGFTSDINMNIHLVHGRIHYVHIKIRWGEVGMYCKRQYINHKISCTRLSFAWDHSSVSKRLERNAKPLCVCWNNCNDVPVRQAGHTGIHKMHAHNAHTHTSFNGQRTSSAEKGAYADNSTRYERLREEMPCTW